jgi:hypothetical protein
MALGYDDSKILIYGGLSMTDIYDDQSFFEAYSQMPRSKYGLRNCLRSKLSFGILLQKRKLLCLIIPVILLANSLKSFAQN